MLLAVLSCWDQRDWTRSWGAGHHPDSGLIGPHIDLCKWLRPASPAVKEHICYWAEIIISPCPLMPDKESFLGFKVDDFPWSPQVMSMMAHRRLYLLLVLAARSLPGALTIGKQEAGLPVMQRLPCRPHQGTHLTLFQQGPCVQLSAPLAPGPWGHTEASWCSWSLLHLQHTPGGLQPSRSDGRHEG